MNGAVVEGAGREGNAESPEASPGGGSEPISVVTRMSFAATPEQVWKGMMFYEQIIDRPPVLLRLLLPVPTGTEGRRSRVGDITRCLYEHGSLLKRVTAIDRGRRYDFIVSEQNLFVGGGMRRLGGCYTLRRIQNGRTEVSLTTGYVSPKRPRWFWQPIEAAVCHAFHRHILRAMRRQTRAGNSVVGAASVHSGKVSTI